MVTIEYYYLEWFVRRNEERRAALLDGAIDVLAEQGARGLTFRAVDASADVPAGTSSNYFRNRDDLLTQAGGRVYERLQPDANTIARSIRGPRNRKRVEALMNELLDRITAYRTGYLALLELRLEATRRPELRKLLTERIREDLDNNITYHLDSGLPGDATSVRLLYLSMSWLIVDRLTLPDLFTEDETCELVTAAVQRLIESG